MCEVEVSGPRILGSVGDGVGPWSRTHKCRLSPVEICVSTDGQVLSDKSSGLFAKECTGNTRYDSVTLGIPADQGGDNSGKEE